MSAESLFVFIGTAIGLVRALPQLLRLLRARDARGVSVDTAGTSSVVSGAWTTYGLLTGQAAVAAASGASAVMFGAVTVVALRFGRRLGEMRTTAVWLLTLLVVALAGGAGGLGVLLPVSVLVANLPQLLVAWREPDLTGLSLGTWMLSVLEAAVWGAYGLLAGDQSILVYGTLQLTTSGAIVGLRLAKRGREAPAR